MRVGIGTVLSVESRRIGVGGQGVVVVVVVVGPDAGVGLGLPNTKPTISKALAYIRLPVDSARNPPPSVPRF